MPIFMNKDALGGNSNPTKQGNKSSLNFTKPGEKQGFNPQPDPPGMPTDQKVHPDLMKTGKKN